MQKVKEPDPEVARRTARDLWFAIQRMARRKIDPPEQPRPIDPDDLPDDDGEAPGSGVPRRPAPTTGSAAVELRSSLPTK